MLDVLTGFVAELRHAGLPVSVTEEADAAEAIGHLPLEDRQAIKFALGATLVKSANHWRAFDTAFEIYFSLRGAQFSVGGDDDSSRDDAAGLSGEGKGQARPGTGGAEPVTPEEIAAMLYRALRNGDQTRQVNDYIETAIAPVISSSEKYPFIHRLCKMQGADPKKELYNAMSERYAKTRKAPDPAAFAAELERNIKSHFVPASSLPSANANPGQPATPARAGTPPASEVPRRATVADPPAWIRRRQSAQPYVSRPKAG